MWGLLSAPLFNKYDGILYVGDKLSFKLLGWNLLGGISIILWTALLSSVLFLTLRFFKKLKVKPEVELKGKVNNMSLNLLGPNMTLIILPSLTPDRFTLQEETGKC